MIYKEFENELKNLSYNKDDKIKYHKEVMLINDKFMRALFNKHNIGSHPKAKLLFDKSWDFGHSSGYSEVEIYFDELVELIK